MLHDPLPAVRDPIRLAALRRTCLLDSRAEAAFDRLTRFATAMLNVPVALVSLVDEDRQFFKSCVGLPQPWATERETPLSHSFCQHVVALSEPLVISDAREHPLVRENLAIPDLGVVAYAGIPLITSDGDALGSFCAIDTEPRVWTEQEIDVLHELAASTVSEIELRLQTQVAQQALQARDAVLATVSHDLRHPVVVIQTFAHLLEQWLPAQTTPDTERLRMGVEKIGAAATALQTQIDELLDTARPEDSRALAPHYGSVDLVALAEEVVAQYQETTERHRIRVEAAVPKLVATVDAGRAARMLANLLSNAIKFSPGGGEIRVEAGAEEDGDGRWAVLVVRDEGIGIPARDLPHIFDRFHRASNVIGRIPGTGLGLTSARQIVEQYEGRVDVVSIEGQGTEVTVRFPLRSTPTGTVDR